MTSVYKWVQKLILYQFVVPDSTLIQWSLTENDRRTYEEMHFENGQKSTYHVVGILTFATMFTGHDKCVEMSTEAETAPDCSTL